MAAVDRLPALSVGLIVVVALLSGPYGVVDLTTAPDTCDEDVFPGQGNATVDVADAPRTLTLTESRFGATVTRLQIPPTRVQVTDVRGRPILTLRLRIPALATEIGSTTVLSDCTTGRLDLGLEATFEPGQIQQDSYDATLFVIYRGTERGEQVERELLARNVTVEVAA